MLNVFFTIDTEITPCSPNWRKLGLAREIDRYVYGITSEGEYGLRYQMKLLNEYGLRAVVFVESLFASAAGLEPLRQIVEMIQAAGHEIQLHLHTEWLERMTDPILPGRVGKNLKEFSAEEQATLIARGLENLRACGVTDICAFRAGNYGANRDTFSALSRNGLAYDSSQNVSRPDSLPLELIHQPRQFDGIYEFPISFFSDWPGHYRPVQLCACSSRELEQALLGAWEGGWYSFVLVSHSFELVKNLRPCSRPLLPNQIVIQRFERLCRFLADHPDKFRTATFSEIVPEQIPDAPPHLMLRSSLYQTAWRVVEQLLGRMR